MRVQTIVGIVESGEGIIYGNFGDLVRLVVPNFESNARIGLNRCESLALIVLHLLDVVDARSHKHNVVVAKLQP